ncbi:hypothetical protein L218DRAFT_935046 [Marasmius fiardii PR-910]|nr:hypothetical protein L218DRAFT_935046 [Marasmius fiardii PR-910]
MEGAAATLGPQAIQNHCLCDSCRDCTFQLNGSPDWRKFTGIPSPTKVNGKSLPYIGSQTRCQRPGSANRVNGESNDDDVFIPLGVVGKPILPSDRQVDKWTNGKIRTTNDNGATAAHTRKPLPVEVKCMARTRIPTPHGPAFLHLYHNNRDSKEHLAIVIDPVQLNEPGQVSTDLPRRPHIRSQSLDAVWSDTETEMDRITRGAYVGRLSSTPQKASTPPPPTGTPPCAQISPNPHGLRTTKLPPPLIRIHSECFTGETIGSMRCDCGEQLDEAIRQISQPVVVPVPSFASSLSSDSSATQTQTQNTGATATTTITIPGYGAVIYLRQEGRGIGLLSKIRAYNLQDLGHDTVTNLMLGYGADERGYEVAGAIIRDLGLGKLSNNGGEGGVRMLTNNPDKVEALEKEGIRVLERVPMVPRSWRDVHDGKPNKAQVNSNSNNELEVHANGEGGGSERKAGATLVGGGGAVYGEDLERYLRTKVSRMGHLLPLKINVPKT